MTMFGNTRSLLSIPRGSGAHLHFRSSIAMVDRLMHGNVSLQQMDSNMKAHDVVVGEEDIQAANRRYKGILEIKESDFGRGLFALRDFHVGELIMSATATQVTENKNSHTVQTGWNSHALMDLPASMINHNCSANVGIKDNTKGCYDWFAMTKISKGEELLADYETFENEIEGFNCSCGSPVCRNVLLGFSVHKEQLLDQYDEKYIAAYLKQQT